MYGERPSRTYSAPVMSSGINGSCGTYATSSARRLSDRKRERRPVDEDRPGRSPRGRTTARSSDDLPAPLGPIRPSHSPERIVSVNGATATERP